MVTCSEPMTPVPSLAVAATVTVPGKLAVSKPLGLIVATPASPAAKDHATVLLAAVDGDMDALICTVPPTVTELAPDTEILVTKRDA